MSGTESKTAQSPPAEKDSAAQPDPPAKEAILAQEAAPTTVESAAAAGTTTNEESPAQTGPPDSSSQPVAAPLPPAHWAEVAQDDEESDRDSALGDDAASSTASLSSSILDYRTINGRTFHSERGNAQYWGANDDRSSESLDILHHLFTLCLEGELYLAPIQDPKKILDIGTGTGIWAIDVADKFPSCEVIGTDISPIQPGWVPPNLKFEIEDCTQVWTYPDSEFDFVHIRYLLGSVVDWGAFFKQAYRCCKPGGYLESYEASTRVLCDDGTLPPKSATAQWTSLFIDGGKAIGRSFTIVDDGVQRKAMEDAGFVDIQEKNIKVPSGGWPKDPKMREIGLFAQGAVDQDIEGFIVFVSTVLNWSKEEVQVYIAHLRREFRAGKFHAYYWQKVVWGRKPEA